MIIQCPNCSSRFVLNPLQLGMSGRKVKCAKCGHIWHQAPADEMGVNAPSLPPVQSPPAAPAPAAAQTQTVQAESDITMSPPPAPQPADASPSLEHTSQPIVEPSSSAEASTAGDVHLPAVIQPPRLPRWVGYALWATSVAAVVATLVLAPQFVVMQWPPAHRLYSTLGLPIPLSGEGLELRGMKLRLSKVSSGAVLVVEGQVANPTRIPRVIPKLEALLMDERQQPLRTWHIQPNAQRLLPDEAVHFKTHVPDADPHARSIVLRFTLESANDDAEVDDDPQL